MNILFAILIIGIAGFEPGQYFLISYAYQYFSYEGSRGLSQAEFEKDTLALNPILVRAKS